MTEQPSPPNVIRATGVNGTVVFDGEWLTIVRSGFQAMVMKAGAGDVRLHINQVTGIDMRAPGIVRGRFTVIAAGAMLRPVGAKAHASDPLSIDLGARHHRDFLIVRDAVLRAIADRQRPVRASQGPDLAGQLAQLGEMYQRGLLSEQEFTEAKARLLGHSVSGLARWYREHPGYAEDAEAERYTEDKPPSQT